MLVVRMKLAKNHKKKHNLLENYIYPAAAAFTNSHLSTQFECKAITT